MKITQFRDDGKSRTQRVMEIEAALDAMRTEIKSQPVTHLRQCLQYAHPTSHIEAAQRLPKLIFGCALRKTVLPQEAFVYNGLVTLEVNQLADRKEAEKIRREAASLPQTLAAFIGSSNRTVKIIVPFTLPDGLLPQERELAELFHAHAYREAVKWYQPQIKHEITLKCPNLEQAIRMTFDPNVYYNSEAMPIRLEQPMRMPAEPTFEEKRKANTDPLQRLLPGYERYDIIAALFSTSLTEALNQIEYKENWKEDLQPYYIRLAQNCFHSGIPEEDAVRWTLHYDDFAKHEMTIRTCFRTVYTTKKMFGDKPCMPKNMTLIARLEEFMQRRYQFRRNVMKQMVEYRELKTLYFDFRPLTKRTANSIGLNAQYEGLEAWDADVRRYLESDRVPLYNPVEDYLDKLGEWDGKDRIRPLADRVACDRPEVWRERFHTWFLSMVAHWQGIDRKHANSTVPLLIGDQGCGKSTFCAALLPRELNDYYTDSIDLSNRHEAERALNRFLLINMDEFDSISPSYQGFMKHIIQKAVVQSRVPYGTVTEKLRRYATFIATSNNFDLLTDPTGSRRFVCVEVKGIIDYQQPIDHKQLYAQAVAELRAGERYWFTHEEEAEITNDNRRFQRDTIEEESFYLYFHRPKSGEKYEELTCLEILEYIKKHQKGFKYTSTTAMKLGRALKVGFENRRVHRGTVYRVAENA